MNVAGGGCMCEVNGCVCVNVDEREWVYLSVCVNVGGYVECVR